MEQVGYTAQPKEQAARSFLEWQKGLTAYDILVFSDGSRQQNLAGAGFYVRQGRVLIKRKDIPLGPNQEVCDAEALAALRGLQAAVSSPGAPLAENVFVCLDNLEVAVRLLHLDPPESSQWAFLEFRELAKQWPARERLAHIPTGRVQVRWCPGHQSIPGNEEADREAKKGAARAPQGAESATQSSLAALRQIARRKAKEAITEYWSEAAPRRYQDLHIPWSFNTPKELSVTRRLLGALLAARTGHGDFKEYHERFKHEDAMMDCSCGRPKTPEHFFFCTRGRRRSRALLGGPPSRRIPELLGTPKGAFEFASWAGETAFYGDICKR
jgi:ribonuclease HI